jgi:hypothetical protein
MSDDKSTQGSKLYSLLGKVQSAEKLFLSGRRTEKPTLGQPAATPEEAIRLIKEANRGVLG